MAQITLGFEPVAAGLRLPLGVAHAGDGSGRLFIVEQAGRILIHDGGQVLPTPFLDASALVSCCGEQGLLGLAFHPTTRRTGSCTSTTPTPPATPSSPVTECLATPTAPT